MAGEKEIGESMSAAVIGNDFAVAALKKFAADVNNGAKRKPLLVFGPSGTGKTMAVHMLAREAGWNIVEMNASDYRDKESIERLMVAASQSRTLFGGRNMILMDEIDELAPRFDKGASTAINDLIKTTKNPIVFIANDMWDQSISFLRNVAEPVAFKKLTTAAIAQVVARHARDNGLTVDREIMDTVAARSNGDARSAINDVTALDNAPKDALDVMGMRDRKVDIFTTLDKIFFSNTFSAPLSAAANADVDNDMLIRWIDENLPKRYVDSEDLNRAYEMLSGASMFARRASSSQYYTYWRYMNAMMTSGIALAKANYPDRMQRYSFPKTISELSKSKEARGSGKLIAQKLRKKIHTNTSRIVKFEMKMIAEMARKALKEAGEVKGKEDEVYDYFIAKYGLEKKEVDWLVENAK